MQFFYSGQMRRYISQTIRFFSNFVVRYGDGTLHQIPAIYGDADRQSATIMHQNSENIVNSVPRISVYITDLKLDRDRLADATYVGKLNVRERCVDATSGAYNSTNGRNYTVERIMPTPFTLKMKVDVWASNTDQKLQILEQILIFFNPSVEFQTSSNYIDWTSLTVVNLDDINWSSRSVPVGTNITIDIATLTLSMPIWLSPPIKVKQLGVITNVITNLYATDISNQTGYIDGLGVDTAEPTTIMKDSLTSPQTTISNYNISVYGDAITLMNPSTNTNPPDPFIEIPSVNSPLTWDFLFAQYPGKFINGVSTIYLKQANGSEVAGTVSLSDEPTVLTASWFSASLPPNTGIDSQGNLETDPGYNPAGSNRPLSPGTFDAIINPTTYNPKRPNGELVDQSVSIGTRFLIIENIGDAININIDGADAWKSTSNVGFIAKMNDIIEWTGNQWNVIFDAINEHDTIIWETNVFTNIQYKWNGVSWIKSFDNTYRAGTWRLVL